MRSHPMRVASRPPSRADSVLLPGPTCVREEKKRICEEGISSEARPSGFQSDEEELAYFLSQPFPSGKRFRDQRRERTGTINHTGESGSRMVWSYGSKCHLDADHCPDHRFVKNRS